MKFSLNTTVIEPENNEDVQNAVILLHGYEVMVKILVCLHLIGKDF